MNTSLSFRILIFQHLNSVLKTFASALELMFTAILSRYNHLHLPSYNTFMHDGFHAINYLSLFGLPSSIFFGIAITTQTVVAILLVSGEWSFHFVPLVLYLYWTYFLS